MTDDRYLELLRGAVAGIDILQDERGEFQARFDATLKFIEDWKANEKAINTVD